jgi:hypothetical protein
MISTTASTAVLIISAIRTKVMVTKMMTSSSLERFRKMLAIMTIRATAMWMRMLRWFLTAYKRPWKA